MRPQLQLAGVVASLASLVLAGSARAYRPFDGTDADVAELGEFELELGPVGYYRLGGEHYLVAPGTVLNYGAAEGLEIVLQSFNYLRLDAGGTPGDQLVDSELNAKVVVRRGCLQEATGASVATEIGLLLPDINGQPGLGGSAALIVTQCAGRAFTVHYNGAVALTLNRNLDLFGGAILEGPKFFPVRPVAELFVDQEVGSESLTTWSALGGAIWAVARSVDLDAGLRAGTIDGSGFLEARLGLTWRIH